MNNDHPLKALVVVFTVALVCSVLVSTATVALKPVQLRNQLIERSRNIVALSGLIPVGDALPNDEILKVVERLDMRVVNLETGEFDASIDPLTFDSRAAANDPELSVAIPTAEDSARLGRRSRFAIAYLVWEADRLQRIILPIHGQGMWSTLYGYIALEADLNTIAAISFYEQAETAGLGDQVERPDWQVRWQGRRLFDNQGNVRFRVASGTVQEETPAARHQVDGLTGATVTGDAVTRLIQYWFGPHGYGAFLDKMAAQQPVGTRVSAGTAI